MSSIVAVTEVDARDARRNISAFCLRTPLVRFNWQAPPGHPGEGTEIFLKLENLQPAVNSFKLRGAGNAIAHLSESDLQGGLVTASAGNMAQGLAANAKRLGCPCTTVVPDHAPRSKLEATERLGCRIIKVPFEEWWKILETSDCPQVKGHFIHPVLDQRVVIGNSTRKSIPASNYLTKCAPLTGMHIPQLHWRCSRTCPKSMLS